MGAFSSLATLCITRSFAATDASVVMPFNFLKLPFAVVIGLIMFAEAPDLWTFAGAAIIFGSSYYIARREAKASAAAALERAGTV
jgi:drug/metabolite transporter (DMT)-like permease